MRKVSLFFLLLIFFPTVNGDQVIPLNGRGSSPQIFDIDQNPANGKEIIVGAFLEGNYAELVDNFALQGTLYVVDGKTGAVRSGWPQMTNLDNYMGGVAFSSPAVADLRSGNPLDIAVTYDEVYGSAASTEIRGGIILFQSNGDSDPRRAYGSPVRAYLWAKEITGSIVLNAYSSPVIADIDNDTELEITFGRSDNNLYVYYRDSPSANGYTGVECKRFMGGVPTTPAVSDIDNDGDLDIVVAVNTGKIYTLNTTLCPSPNRALTDLYPPIDAGGIDRSSPTLADLDGDGDLEIISTSTSGYVSVWHHDGTPFSGLWPVYAGPTSISSPTVGDVDNNGDLEIAVATNDNKVFLYSTYGVLFPNFPKQTETGIDTRSSPILADITGDGNLEIILGTAYQESGINKGKIYAWDINGNIISGFPKNTGEWIDSTPAVADLDGDGTNEIVVGCDDKKLYIFNGFGPEVNTRGWKSFHYNERNTRQWEGTVTLSNVAPTASIVSPPDGGSFKVGDPITFSGTGDDLDGSITGYQWSSSKDGLLSTASSFSTSNLSTGSHTITFTVFDDKNAVGSDAITIIVLPNLPPVVQIHTPSDGDSFTRGVSINFTASGTDSDGSITGYRWYPDLDGDLSTQLNFSTDTLAPGLHTITLEMSDDKGGIGLFSISIEIKEPKEPESPPSGGGGGGGGTPKEGVLEKIINSIDAGSSGSVYFTDLESPFISDITLESKENAYYVKITLTPIEEISSTFKPIPEPYEVIRYMKITTTGIPASSLEGATIGFKVRKDKLRERNMSQLTVSLYRYNSGWEVLPTIMVGEDSGYIYYTATTPGFSYFAIVGKPGSGFIERPADVAFPGPHPTITEPPLPTEEPEQPEMTVVPTTAISTSKPPQSPKEKGICGPSAIMIVVTSMPWFTRRFR